MKKTFSATLFALFFFSLTTLSAKPTSTSSEADSTYSFSVYGFVRNDFTFDSRRTMGAVGELFSFLPYDSKIASDGTDENAIPTSRFLAVTTRMGFDMKSPIYSNNFNFKAKIEADFCGGGKDIYYVRIRQAYTTLAWGDRHSLQVGQAWHPLTLSNMPSMVSLNTGTPFNPFSRAPQIRYDLVHKGFNITAAAIYQLQYTSPGPSGNSMEYQKMGLPEVYVGAQINKDNFTIGVGGEFMQINPRCYASNGDETYKVRENVRSFAGQLHIKYANKHFALNAKTTFGQNMGHVLSLSGYAVTGKRSLSNPGWEELSYTPLSQSQSWITLSYNTANPIHNINTTLFAGYMKNFGTLGKPVVGDVYMRGFDNMDQMMRVSPSIRYHFHDMCVGLEYEWTGVLYGDKKPDLSVTNTHLINNHRIYAMLVYNFQYSFRNKK